MKNEFLEFLTQRQDPPESLSQMVQKDVRLSFHKKSILSRFLFLQLLGALISLSVCPQFGIGLAEGHGITHSLRLISDYACAAFCGLVFLSSGALMNFIGMKSEENWWVWRRYKFSLMLLPAALWGILMLGNFSLDLATESMGYHLVWLVMAMSLIFLQNRYYLTRKI